MTCYKCGINEVFEELTRCASCEVSHKELCAKLDSKPKNHTKSAREELFPIKEMKGGIPVTTWINRMDAANMGIKL